MAALVVGSLPLDEQRQDEARRRRADGAREQLFGEADEVEAGRRERIQADAILASKRANDRSVRSSPM